MKRVAVSVLLVVAFLGCRKTAPNGDAPAAPAPTARSGDPWKQEAAKPAAAADGYLPRPLLWSIEKDGKTSYAFGTIHVGVDANEKLPPAVWNKLEASPTFAMETDLSDPAILKSLQCVGCSLRRELGEEYYAKLENILDANVAKMVDGMKPMVAATMVAMKGLPETAQMDTLLLARAQNKHAQIVFLEPATHQAALLEKHMNIKALKVMLADPAGTLDGTKKLLAAYLEGDDVKMVALNAELKQQSLANGFTEKEYDESQEDMLYKRNASWIAPIEKLHAAGGGFIAVGALHLVGPRSVLDLLAKKGYKITRM
ncbi:MAG: TraB/GumN family protein [Kofleriaceae bacterium]|nr:TraB/GumN family protein [Kofleriaceae bacterium]